ncbi:MAG: penicillin acylase family protein, partial [Chitinophagaceae bacterium]
DIQTRAAGGRVSEVAGAKAIEFDRGQRRKGMVFGAEKSLKAMESDPRTKAMLDAYRDGINAYVQQLDFRKLPIEYKLMGFYPEAWTNLRTALLLKYMADDLTGKTDDIAFTQLRDKLGQKQFDFLFPERIKGSKPVIPEGTKFDKPSLQIPPTPGDSVWAHFPEQSSKAASISKKDASCNKTSQTPLSAGGGEGRDGGHQEANATSRDKQGIPGYQTATAEEASGIGSNNWAISGTHTASGKPILCNDPHLALNLPCLWFEMQLTAPGVNSYGVSLPGAPGIIIGFNDKISWGFTNNYRDVKDFYEITPISSRHAELVSASITKDSGWERPLAYIFCGKEIPFQKSIEVIKVKGHADVVDTVLYTLHGPVMYDPSFPDETKSGKLLACTWMGHRGTNELLSVYLLNRAQNYDQFVAAIQHFECPAQNFVYADVVGNIAMWGQGKFINKWRGQGKYVMEGHDSATLWGQDIPMMENPHVLNPPQGYLASANQQVTDSTYPYWYNGNFTEWRSWRINEILSQLNEYTASIEANDDPKKWDKDQSRPKIISGYRTVAIKTNVIIGAYTTIGMQELQNDVFSTIPDVIHSVGYDSAFESKYQGPKDSLPSFMLFGDLLPKLNQGTIYEIGWYFFYKDIWQDEFPANINKWPSSEFTVQLLLRDSTSSFFDDKTTPQKEGFRDIMQRAFNETKDSLDRLRAAAPPRLREQSLEWYQVKNTSLTHLAKIPAFSYDHLKIGGWSNTINAATGNHGPSWRMIVEMDSIPKAYAIYPGGQSGNPGSKYYSDYIEKWVEGRYFTVHFLIGATTKNPFKYTWTISPGKSPF